MKNNKGKKGQSVLLSHAIIVSFGIIMVFVVVTTFASLHEQFQNFTATNEIDQLCLIIKGAAEKAVYTGDYVSPSGTESIVSVNLPDKIADASYTAVFENESVTIETTAPKFVANCKIGINATYTGETTGGVTEIIFNNTATRTLEMSTG